MLRKIFKLVTFYILCTTLSNNLFAEVNLSKIEILTGILRIPSTVIKNELELKSKTKFQTFFIFSTDVLRLASEILSIINNNGEFEVHKHDYAWAVYDAASLIMHVVDVFKSHGDECQNSEDIKKLEGLLKIVHTKVLPFLEGLMTCIASFKESRTIDDSIFRLKCKTLNSSIRLLDNIIISKNKSLEQVLYGALLMVNIIFAIKDIYGINKIKDVRIKPKQTAQQAQATQKGDLQNLKIQERLDRLNARIDELKGKNEEFLRKLKETRVILEQISSKTH